MSQLRNLLTNRVIASKVGNVSKFRRHLRAHGRTTRRVLDEIAERQEIATASVIEQKVQKLTVLGRVSRFLRRVAKGA